MNSYEILGDLASHQDGGKLYNSIKVVYVIEEKIFKFYQQKYEIF